MKGRTVPPARVIIASVPDDPSWEVDKACLVANPHIIQYTRAYIPGESPEPMPHGTMVIGVGAYRWRCFQPPQEGLN
jgi:hypothetical protein